VLVAGIGTPGGGAPAAGTQGGVIGLAGGLPWSAPEDMKFFKRVTMGTVVLMGRRTFDSILRAIGRPLPGRTNVVVTRGAAEFAAAHPGVIARETLAEAVVAARAECARLGLTTISVAGGGVIYTQSLPLADELLLTHHDYSGPGDTFFPAWDRTEWTEISRGPVGAAVAVRYRRAAGPARG
jgi:dihydrofolate reductase